MEPIDVVARFKEDGKILPVSFTWKGVSYPVVSTGRHWRDDQGFHILIMAPGGRVYELNFNPVEIAWNLQAIGPVRGTA